VILLSAFEPFGDDDINSSYEVLIDVVEELIDTRIGFITLPVSYERAVTLIHQEIALRQPTYVVCFGQAAGRAAITVETTANNVVGVLRDNDNAVLEEGVVVKGAQTTLASTLPVAALIAAARNVGVDAQESHSAGEYVCNYLFYSLQHHLSNSPVASGFVHLPIIESQLEVHREIAHVTQADQVRAVSAMVRTLLAS
jgi:pyroglutamyl-peptidase